MDAREPFRVEAEAMVERLGPLPAEVARAMRSIPRHAFVPVTLRSEAYDDTPLPLSAGGATISAPHMVALQLTWAELRPGNRVLEIGSGSGYLAALLAELVGPDGTVDGVEVVPALAHEADRVLGRVTGAVRPRIHVGDGRDGFPAGAPFDRILVSCATSTLFDAWRSQLAPGGRLVAPLGDAWGQELVLYRGGDPPGSLRRGPECLFVPLRGPLSFDI